MAKLNPLWCAAILTVSYLYAPSTFGADKAEDALIAKGFRRSGEVFVLRAEDDVKKAADAVDARLKEFRLAVMREKYSVRSEAEKKVMAANLTKQYTALKQQYNQAMPELRAQMQALSQQRAAIRQQLEGLQYASSNASTAAWNQLVTQSNGLNTQLNTLANQRDQFVDTLNEMASQIEQLQSRAGPDEPTLKTAVSSEDRSDAYMKAVEALRAAVDETKKAYETLAADDEVKGALETLNKKSAKIRYVLGPSKKFLDAVAALEQAEARGKPDPSEVTASAPKASLKKKAKTVTRKAGPASRAATPTAKFGEPAEDKP